MLRLYASLPTRDIATMFSTTEWMVLTSVRRMGGKVKPPGQQPIGHHVTPNGYRKIRLSPDDPMACMLDD